MAKMKQLPDGVYAIEGFATAVPGFDTEDIQTLVELRNDEGSLKGIKMTGRQKKVLNGLQAVGTKLGKPKYFVNDEAGCTVIWGKVIRMNKAPTALGQMANVNMWGPLLNKALPHPANKKLANLKLFALPKKGRFMLIASSK